MEARPIYRELTDGIIVLRQPTEADVELLINGRDDEFHRFMGVGSSDPRPTAVVLDDAGQIVGWVDHDSNRDWLVDGEVNVGYNIFADHRGHGFAQRSLALLISFLAEDAEFTAATLLIDPANAPSIAIAERTGFVRHDDVDGQLFYKRPARDWDGLHSSGADKDT